MDSLDAQRLLVSISTAEGCAPSFWVHAQDGSLGYRFPSSSNVWSWPANEVAEIAERWRSGASDPLPRHVAKLVAAHQAFVAMLESGEIEQPDVILHDLEAVELRALWHEARLEVLVDTEDPGRTIDSLADREAA